MTTLFSKRWTDYYFDLAERASAQSKDPSTKHGAVLVNNRKRIIGIGFNGFPSAIDDLPDLLSNREVKNTLIIHAEVNAIDNAMGSVEGAHMFITGAPCSKCALRIVQEGIKTVHWRVDTRPDYMLRWADDCKLAQSIFDRAGVEYYEYKSE